MLALALQQSGRSEEAHAMLEPLWERFTSGSLHDEEMQRLSEYYSERIMPRRCSSPLP